MSSQITLAAPPARGWGGRRQDEKETNTKKLQPRAPIQRPDYPDHGPALLSGGGGRTKKNAGTTPNPDLKTQKHQKQPEEKNPGLKTQKNGKLSSASAA